MPTSEAPANVNEPQGPIETSLEAGSPEAGSSVSVAELPEPEGGPRTARGSRWVDYDTHELLEMISELEDERRWSRLREGFWIAILVHLALISAITWIPKYVLKVPPVIDPFDAIKQHDLTYLQLPQDALKDLQEHKAKTRPVEKPPALDKKTLEALNHPPIVPAPAAPPPPPVEKAPEVKPQPTQPIPPSPQAQIEAPRPAAVPARPNFAMGSQNPADQLQQAMRNAARSRGAGDIDSPIPGGLTMHPGAGTGGIQVLSDTQGVDFTYWLERWHYDTERTWDPLIPDEVNPPINKSGMVAIRFKVLPNGRVMDGSMQLDGRSGDTALDRAAWGAITGSTYPPLPRDFHGPYIELRAFFLYNMQPSQ